MSAEETPKEKMNKQTIKTITVLPVKDIEEVAKWYEKSIAFHTVYLHEGDKEGEATNYATLQRDDVTFSLILDESPKHESSWTKAGSGYLYLIVKDIEKEYREAQSRGTKISRELRTESWGARGFNLRDPSGNEIRIEQAQ